MVNADKYHYIGFSPYYNQFDKGMLTNCLIFFNCKEEHTLHIQLHKVEVV